MLQDACAGKINFIEHEPLLLPARDALDFYSEAVSPDRWFSPLQLQVIGSVRGPLGALEMSQASDALRLASPPFDGIPDITSWLGLKPFGGAPVLSITVLPPVELSLAESSLQQGKLRLVLDASASLDLSKVRLAVRAVPGGVEMRSQVGTDIQWDEPIGLTRKGHVELAHPGCHNALAMLMLGNTLVRRQWFIDPSKSPNLKLAAMQHFDKDLKQLRHALFEAQDGRRFEAGVSAVLDLLGFTATGQLEDDAPDLVATTPLGKLIVVECTTRIADFFSKVGKLVDRRGSLSKFMQAEEVPCEVHAVLVCRLPRDQLAAQEQYLKEHNVLLATREDLEEAAFVVRYQNDPDAMLTRALGQQSRGLFSSAAGARP